jgi:hypothetical protein
MSLLTTWLYLWWVPARSNLLLFLVTESWVSFVAQVPWYWERKRVSASSGTVEYDEQGRQNCCVWALITILCQRVEVFGCSSTFVFSNLVFWNSYVSLYLMLLISESCDAGCMSVVTVSHLSGWWSTLATFRCPQQSACGASTENRFTNVALVDLIGAIFLLLVCPICRKWWMVELSTTGLVSIFRDLYKRMLLLLFALSWLLCAKLLEWYFLCPQFVLGLICCSF